MNRRTALNIIDGKVKKNQATVLIVKEDTSVVLSCLGRLRKPRNNRPTTLLDSSQILPIF